MRRLATWAVVIALSVGTGFVVRDVVLAYRDFQQMRAVLGWMLRQPEVKAWMERSQPQPSPSPSPTK